MLLEYVEKLDESSLLSDDLFIELFGIKDEIQRQRKEIELEDRSKILNCTTKFKKLLKTYKDAYKKKLKNQLLAPGTNENIIVFDDEACTSLNSGEWLTDEIGGIYRMNDRGRDYACYHPIFPAGILRGAEDNLCKTILWFRVRGVWTRIYIDRGILASSNKIVNLAQFGVQVTSENARTLVKYMNDMEALNEGKIREHVSTSKLGWIEDQFVPYLSKEIIFDNDPKLMSLFDSIHEKGSREKWYTLAKNIRAEGHIELLIYMAASLSSVLVKPCGALPFIVSLWGGTGLGKTVALMLATSIWADPSEGAYMSDAKATTTAMEIRLNTLNSLPLCIDDMAQIQTQEDDFSTIIYRWCAGKGRDRSNQNLGLNPLTKWANCILTNGERSLTSESMQGGASNRVLDVEITERMFKNGNAISKSLRANFGFCGKEFVQVVQKMGFTEINKRFDEWTDRLKEVSRKKNAEKEDKQIVPMALILLADEIAETELFKDGVRLDIDKCFEYLKDKNSVSENRRAYDYLRDKVVEYNLKFNPEDPDNHSECWGKWLDDKHCAIIPSVMREILSKGGYQYKTFISWATREKLLDRYDDNHAGKQIQLNKRRVRCIVIDLSVDYEENGEFISITDTEASDLPFT